MIEGAERLATPTAVRPCSATSCWPVERVNERGGVQAAQAARVAWRCSATTARGRSEEVAVAAARRHRRRLRSLSLQGNSSAVAAVLIDAINKHNAREPRRRVVFLNYSAVDPMLTNEKCSFWHFRFDAHADMRMAALMAVLKARHGASRAVYLLGQDYSFGQAVLREARRQLAARCGPMWPSWATSCTPSAA
jgi:branched-chain amino acid transport system substrate-binding protein